jgi:hypothetical protein
MLTLVADVEKLEPEVGDVTTTTGALAGESMAVSVALA